MRLGTILNAKYFQPTLSNSLPCITATPVVNHAFPYVYHLVVFHEMVR
jgi:hypothetical protein